MLLPLVALLLLAPAAAAAAEDPGDEGAPPTPAEAPAGSAARSWFLLPAPFWLPETKAGLALAGGRDFRVEGSQRASTALLVVAYSIERQGSVDGTADVWLRGGSLVAARLRAVHYPDQFFGIGRATPASAREDFTRRFVEAALSAEYGLFGGRLRAGPRIAGRAEEILDVVPGGHLATSGVAGLRGFAGAAAGGSVTWDTRDQPLWPRRGAFAQGYYLRYPASLGRDAGFGKGALDLRLFQPAGGGRVLGVSGVLETTDGATPFSMLSKLGSARFLRGYREGRYRDRVCWAVQTELRAPVAGPFAITVFGAAGDVAADLGSLAADRLKLAAGAGARWRLTPAGANLRVDVAVGDAGPEVYVVLLEAF